MYFSHVYVLLTHYKAKLAKNKDFAATIGPELAALADEMPSIEVSIQPFFPPQYIPEGSSARTSFYKNTRKTYRLVYSSERGVELQHHSSFTEELDRST